MHSGILLRLPERKDFGSFQALVLKIIKEMSGTFSDSKEIRAL